VRAHRDVVSGVVARYGDQSDGRLAINFVDPDADGGAVASQLAQTYGLQPMSASLFSNNRFYFHMLLEKDGQAVQIPLDDLTETAFERNLKAGIKRFAGGFTKSVALVTSPGMPTQFGTPGSEYGQLEGFLSGELNVFAEDLSDGSVSGVADVLLLAGPTDLDEKSVYAVDQFLMQGGTVIAATAPKSANFSQGRIDLANRNSGLQDWLAYQGLSMGESLVMDPQNAAFPAPVTRQVGNMQIQEMRMLNYPYFIDIRKNGLAQDNPITSGLPQLTMAWASPIEVDEEKNSQRQVITLLKSSDQSWLSESIDIMPQVGNGGGVAYSPQGAQGQHTLAAEPVFSGVIKHSADSARLVLFASNDFLRDQVVQMTGSANGSLSLSPFELMANTVDWSLEDTALMQIRSRGQFNRTLNPIENRTRLFWEYLNYALVAVALGIVALLYRRISAVRKTRHRQLITA